MTRNIVEDETAARNREEGVGGYTFNAFPPDDYAGPILLVEAIRLGDHAHVHVSSGRQTPMPHSPWKFVSTNYAKAGRLVLAWDDWLVFREVLDADDRVRIAEIERPTPGMLARYEVGAT